MDQTSGSVITEEWSVHAQLVVHHGNSPNQKKEEPRRTHTGDGGVRMEYSWEPGINSIWETSGTRPSRPSYGFQKGNILFTTSPPQCGINRISENLKGQTQTLPRYLTKSQNLKNLSRSPLTSSDTVTEIHQPPVFDSGYVSEKFNTLPSRRPVQQYERRCRSTCSITLSCDVPYEKPVNRTQSLKSPSLCSRCGTARVESTSTEGNVCEECRGTNKKASRAHTFTTHFCTHVLNDDQEKDIKDASSQTQNEADANEKRKNSKERFLKPEILISDAKDGSDESKPKTERRTRLFRSPAKLRGKSPLLEKIEKEREEKKPPRTVHIDVYCTGSDEADESDSLTSDEEPAPHTVYENNEVKVTHRRAGKNEIPIRRKRKILNPPAINLPRKSEEDLSSQYPSVESSRATLLESFGSLPTISSGILRSDDTIATSWKDTENLSLLEGSGVSLTQSDSFEYADSLDKHRIKQLENKLSESKSWKSPQTERKSLLREKIFNDYLESHLRSFPLWKQTSSQDSSDSDESHESEVGWTFIHSDDKITPKESNDKTPVKRGDSGSLSDSTPSTIYRYKRRDVLGPFGVKPPSPPPTKLENTVTSPVRTECSAKAQLFGPIVGTLRKPGHHVGPAKNPDCTCKSCSLYFAENRGRGRARSVGDVPVHPRSQPDFLPPPPPLPPENEEEVAAIREEISELIANQWDLIQNLV